MKLTTQELAIVSKLIDLNYEYFDKEVDNNFIKNQINDNLECYQAPKNIQQDTDLCKVKQEDFYILKSRIDRYFN